MAPFSSFANYTPKPGHYDEVFDADGTPRRDWSGLPGRLGASAAPSCRAAPATIQRAVEQDGVTYNIYARCQRHRSALGSRLAAVSDRTGRMAVSRRTR